MRNLPIKNNIVLLFYFLHINNSHAIFTSYPCRLSVLLVSYISFAWILNYDNIYVMRALFYVVMLSVENCFLKFAFWFRQLNSQTGNFTPSIYCDTKSTAIWAFAFDSQDLHLAVFVWISGLLFPEQLALYYLLCNLRRRLWLVCCSLHNSHLEVLYLRFIHELFHFLNFLSFQKTMFLLCKTCCLPRNYDPRKFVCFHSASTMVLSLLGSSVEMKKIKLFISFQ